MLYEIIKQNRKYSGTYSCVCPFSVSSACKDTRRSSEFRIKEIKENAVRRFSTTQFPYMLINTGSAKFMAT